MQLVNGVPKIICVDFDSTICASTYPGLGPVKPGAKEAMKRLQDLGYHVVISSCRTCKHFPELYATGNGLMGVHAQVHKDMVAWLGENQIPYDEVDDGTKGKVCGLLYVDDKGFRYEDNWADVVRFVEEVLEKK